MIQLPFAGLVFRAFDTNESGAIEFEEYVNVLSVTSRGRLDEKIQCKCIHALYVFCSMCLGTFSFYDLDGDGRISRDELMVVVSAIYRMILNGTSPTVPLTNDNSHGNEAQDNKLSIAATPEERVEQILNEMDTDGDGFITLEEFRTGAHAEPSILQGLLLYDGLV